MTDYLIDLMENLLEDDSASTPKERKRRWTIHGLNYGYPECCIQEFISTHRSAIEEPRKLDGTGYVPCTDCNVRYTEEELVERINANRNPNEPVFHKNI